MATSLHWRVAGASIRAFRMCLPLAAAAGAYVWSQTSVPPSVSVLRNAVGEAGLQRPAVVGEKWQFQSSLDLQTWTPLSTVKATTTTVSYTDSAGPYFGRRFYRSVPITDTTAPVGDHLVTNSGLVTIVPITHGSFYLHWASPAGNKIIYSDPAPTTTVPAASYAALPKADVIVITHTHGDHWSSTVVENVRVAGTRIVAPQPVYDLMTATQKGLTSILKTGQASAANDTAPITVAGLTVTGVPAYNANHTKGLCNSYVLTIGGKKILISGDTGKTAEMEAQTGIDVAFLCMNIPFTLTVADAAASTRIFQPKVVYPYHFKNSDATLANLGIFKTTVAYDKGVEVRVRTWY
jgi:L-ascorbate metabolism protein UlaG (beta-lactamase superfamily)